MKKKLVIQLALAGAALMLFFMPAMGQPDKNSPGEKALAARAMAFSGAFDKGDAKALADFWAPDGDYIDEAGKKVKGREAIQKAFEELFAENKGLKLRINPTGLKAVTPEIAIEDGVTEVMFSDGRPSILTRYTIVHVKKDGKWLLQSVREAPFAPPTNYDQLRALEWVIGDWVDDTSNAEMARFSFSWGANQNFIIATFVATMKDVPVSGGTQWIGWDPVGKHIRSWTFDASGGFGQGEWAKNGNKWIVKSKMTLSNGKQVTATNIVTRIDADNITWQSTDRTVDGKEVKDTKEIKMKRVK